MENIRNHMSAENFLNAKMALFLSENHTGYSVK